MDVDFWNAVFQWGSVGLVAVTFFFGAGALWTSKRINERQTSELLRLSTELATAQSVAAQAQLELEEVRRKQRPRQLHQVFSDVLERGERGKAEVWYQPDDPEAYSLASVLSVVLSEAKWELPPLPRAIGPNDVKANLAQAPPELLRGLPAIMRLTGSSGAGIVLAAKSFPEPNDLSPINTLRAALAAEKLDFTATQDHDLPDGFLRIVVGPKQ